VERESRLQDLEKKRIEKRDREEEKELEEG